VASAAISTLMGCHSLAPMEDLNRPDRRPHIPTLIGDWCGIGRMFF
jgi:hypothetical protein